MVKQSPFEKHSDLYEEWFQNNEAVYLSELEAIRALLPSFGNGLEIGVGSGRFSTPFGIKVGVEPSEKMANIAMGRGITVIRGFAEDLPFFNESFDLALMVTTICFVENLGKSFSEANRILRSGGSLLTGFVDRESPVGQIYLQNRNKSTFYRSATFYSIFEVLKELKKAGFRNFDYTQTIFNPLTEINETEPVKTGYGEGSFVVIRAVK